MRRAWLLGVAAGLGFALAGAASAAELRQTESVGAAPVQPGDSRARVPRDAAVRVAVADSVEEVARSLLPADWEQAVIGAGRRGALGDLDPKLAVALGKDPFEYATRFRILEDRGVRPALFTKDPEVESEYVVLVEVFVDAGRVRERLRSAGWIQPAQAGEASAVRIVVEDLGSYAAYEALRQALVQDLGMDSALPVELSRGRAVLAARGPYDAEGLQAALQRLNGEGLRVVPLSRDGQTLTLLVDYTPPDARAPAARTDPDGSADGDAPAP